VETAGLVMWWCISYRGWRKIDPQFVSLHEAITSTRTAMALAQARAIYQQKLPLVNALVITLEQEGADDDTITNAINEQFPGFARGQTFYTCVLCDHRGFGYGHNPAPLRRHGRCCEECNFDEVIPARISMSEAELAANE